MRIGAAQTAALAAAGDRDGDVRPASRGGGDHDRDRAEKPGRAAAAGEIYESNGRMLEVALAAGRRRRHAARARRGRRGLRTGCAFERALEADVVVSSGGVSVGPHDLVRAVAAELGARELFWGVAMRPGKPLSFAVRDATLVFGLPGNPVSSLVGAALFVLPALRALQGASSPGPRWQSGTLTGSVRRNAHRDDFLRARTAVTDDGTTLAPVVGQESHMIVHAAAADALVHVPRGDGRAARRRNRALRADRLRLGPAVLRRRHESRHLAGDRGPDESAQAQQPRRRPAGGKPDRVERSARAEPELRREHDDGTRPVPSRPSPKTRSAGQPRPRSEGSHSHE